MIHSVIQALRLVRPVRVFRHFGLIGSIGAACSLFGILMFNFCIWQKLTGAHNDLYGRPMFLLSVMLLVLGTQIIAVEVALRIAKCVHRWIR
ncbi:MAG TPA: hypothetical protein VK843_03950 [Planctomycetota bacterium]|nr:hypothetical protein [Planctomycetota bacterium]